MSDWLRRQLFVWVVTACLPLCAQEFRAGISGIVKDSQGAGIPKIAVEAQNIGTGDVNRTVTNEAGEYAFPVLPIGTYRMTVQAPGFKKAIRDKLEVRLGDQVQQDFTLEVGAVNEQVTVSAGTELLQTIATDTGQVVDEENVHDLPSQARNPFLLGIVATGVQFDIGSNTLSTSARPFDTGNNVAESMSIDGGVLGHSDLLLDGILPIPSGQNRPDVLRGGLADSGILSNYRATVEHQARLEGIGIGGQDESPNRQQSPHVPALAARPTASGGGASRDLRR